MKADYDVCHQTTAQYPFLHQIPTQCSQKHISGSLI